MASSYKKQTWVDVDPTKTEEDQSDDIFTLEKIVNIENAIFLANSTMDDTIYIGGYTDSQYTGPNSAGIIFDTVNKVQRLKVDIDKPRIDDTQLSETTMYSKKKIIEAYPIEAKIDVDTTPVEQLVEQYGVKSVNDMLYVMENILAEGKLQQ